MARMRLKLSGVLIQVLIFDSTEAIEFKLSSGEVIRGLRYTNIAGEVIRGLHQYESNNAQNSCRCCPSSGLGSHRSELI